MIHHFCPATGGGEGGGVRNTQDEKREGGHFDQDNGTGIGSMCNRKIGIATDAEGVPEEVDLGGTKRKYASVIF